MAPAWSLDCRKACWPTGVASEFIFLLVLYGESGEKQGCRKRFIELIGLDVELIDLLEVTDGNEVKWMQE